MASSYTDDKTNDKTCQCSEGEKSSTLKSGEMSNENLKKCPKCKILKSGHLFLASKGIGWTSWKKRWFVLTPTSLVFYRSEPNAHAQKGAEANPAIGGIDLDNSGSVVVKADKKLLIVFFPNGRDGQTFTLKGETFEELHEWRAALENALVEAPNAYVAAMAQKEIFHNKITEPVELYPDATVEQSLDRKPIDSTVIRRPVLLALEDVDGSPSFLEKALRFIENYGVKVEGVLRQSADVEEVKCRVHEYEQGKKEFSSDEDAHVIGDCIKYVLRQLPCSPVPASSCTALLEAYRVEREKRLIAIRAAIFDTFPEPNLRLLQRILKMMILVAAHKALNRMSTSALAACMAPLLLRPLLSGDCDFEDNFKMDGDGSLQLLKAAAAANYAQAIVIILLEEYDMIFGDELSKDGSLSSGTCTGSDDDDDDGVEDYELTDSDILDDDDDDGYHDVDNGLVNGFPISSCHNRRQSESSTGENGSKNDSASIGRCHVCSMVGSNDGSSISENEENIHVLDSKDVEVTQTPLCTLDVNASAQDFGLKSTPTDSLSVDETHMQTGCILECVNTESIVSGQNSGPKHKSGSQILPRSDTNCTTKSNEPAFSIRRPTKWGRTSARKNLSMESIDFLTEDEVVIQRLENTKIDLETKYTKEVKDNSVLQTSLARRRETLWERRLKLEKEVELLQEKLQKEREYKASLESGLVNMQSLCTTSVRDSKAKSDVDEIHVAEQDLISLERKIIELRGQLNHHLHPNCVLMCITCNQQLNKKEFMDMLEKIVDNNFIHQNGTSSNHAVSSPKDDHENQSPDHYNSLIFDSKHKRNTSRDEELTLADTHPSYKLPKKITKSKAKCNVIPSTEDSHASKRTPAPKKSSYRCEDAHSSSTLTRLTNRLNFLKERRVQISNELQIADAKHAFTSDPPTLNTSR